MYMNSCEFKHVDLVSALHRRDNIKNRKFSSELINVSVMSGRTQQENSEVKLVAQSCLKNRNLMTNLPPIKAAIMSQAKICKRSQVSRRKATFF